MPTYQVNQLADDSFPEEAALGILDDGVTIDDAAERLGEAGINAERLYFLQGEGGVELLEESGGFFSRFFAADARQPAIAELKDGKTLVLVYGVEEDDADRVRATLRNSCVGETYYFGRWTFSA